MRESIRRAAAVVSTAAALLAGGMAWAGDPGRLTDHGEWPSWAAYYQSDTLAPSDGELVEAIRFEFIQGTPVPDEEGYVSRRLYAERSVTRAEMATMLVRSLSLPNQQVTGGAWYEPSVTALKDLNIIPPDGPTDWNEPMTRMEAGQWLGRAANAVMADSNAKYTTPKDVSDPWFLRAVQAGIIKGNGLGDFMPDRPATRLEAAIMILRLAKARNVRGNRDNQAVLDGLKALIKQADQQAMERERAWMAEGRVGDTSTEGIRTADFASYLSYRASYHEGRNVPQRLHELIQDSYEFTFSNVHDTIASVHVCARAKVHLAGEFYERPYCERQFLVWRDGRWLLASAAGPANLE